MSEQQLKIKRRTCWRTDSKLHRTLLHRVDEANSVCELRATTRDDVVEFRKLLSAASSVGIQNHEDIAGRTANPARTASPFPRPVWLENFDFPCGFSAFAALDLRPRVVARMAFDKDDFGAGAHFRRAQNGSVMLPASLRAGMMTETLNGAERRLTLGRATMKM